jgi:hypothetical protein
MPAQNDLPLAVTRIAPTRVVHPASHRFQDGAAQLDIERVALLGTVEHDLQYPPVLLF